MAFNGSLGLLYAAGEECLKLLSWAENAAGSCEGYLGSASSCAHEASGAVSAAQREVGSFLTRAGTFRQAVRSYMDRVQEFDAAFAGLLAEAPTGQTRDIRSLDPPIRVMLVNALMISLLRQKDLELRKKLAERLAADLAKLLVDAAASQRVVELEFMVGNTKVTYATEVKATTGSPLALAELEASIEEGMLRLALAVDDSNITIATDLDGIKLGIDVDGVLAEIDTTKLLDNIVIFKFSTETGTDHFKVTMLMETESHLKRPNPMPELAPARLPVPIPKAVETPWYDRGWENVLENVSQELQDVGGWIADHPIETGVAIVVVAAIFLKSRILLNMSKAKGAFAGMAVLPSIDTERVERELERILEKDMKDTEDEEDMEGEEDTE